MLATKHGPGFANAVSATLIPPLLRRLSGESQRRAFFEATGLTPAWVADRDARITASQLAAAWAELARITGDQHVSLSVAKGTEVGTYGVVEYLCRSAPSLGDALREWVRYLNLLNEAVGMALVEEGDQAWIRIERESVTPAPASHELCFALLSAQACALCQRGFVVSEVRFTHRAPGAVEPFERWFRAPVVFESARTELGFAQALLAEPLVSADPNLAALLRGFADQHDARIEGQAGQTTLEAEVRRLVAAGLRAGGGAVTDVAASLGVSPRSLQRRLREEGTSFSRVREDVQRTLAERYLRQPLSLTEISFLLGFSEPSAFHRAFRRWTGRTPVEHRRALGDRELGAG